MPAPRDLVGPPPPGPREQPCAPRCTRPTCTRYGALGTPYCCQACAAPGDPIIVHTEGCQQRVADYIALRASHVHWLDPSERRLIAQMSEPVRKRVLGALGITLEPPPERPTRKCGKSDCRRRVSLSSHNCCGPCATADEYGFETHMHSTGCEERYLLRGEYIDLGAMPRDEPPGDHRG